MRIKNNTFNSSNDRLLKLIAYFAAGISLVVTPWFNKESITIPKFILLSILASYLLPNLYNEVKLISKVTFIKFVVFVQLLTTIHLFLVVVLSEAPIEQQLFGRSGRLLGLITYFCFIILFVSSIRYVNILRNVLILRFFVGVGALVAIYAVFQSFGLDFMKWDTRTNSVISTLGNPNFVSAFIAAVTLPALFIIRTKPKTVMATFVFAFSLFAIYRTESIQGFISLLVAFLTYTVIYSYYHLRKYISVLIFLVIAIFVFVISGTLGHGILSNYLYKVSIESRGDFWRGAFAMANGNPFFGVGLDSFGDNYLRYRDQVAANHSFAEFTDSAHNYLLDYASQGGYPLLVLQLTTIFSVFTALIITLRKYGGLNTNLVITFCAWLSLQSTFLISPISTPLMVWSVILSGAIIGTLFHANESNYEDKQNRNKRQSYSLVELFRIVIVFVTTILIFPLYQTDTLFLNSLNSSNGNLGMKVIDMFPRSTSKYFTVGKLLFESGQNQYSLEVARKATEFNKKSINAWGLILVNPLASYEERLNARNKILELDPFNKEVPNYEIIPSS